MKHLKTYEEVTIPEIGDWVIMKFIGFENSPKRNIVFMKNHVAQIIDLKSPSIYEIDFYENIAGMTSSKWHVTIDNIRAFSKNKEELEVILAANKYNL